MSGPHVASVEPVPSNVGQLLCEVTAAHPGRPAFVGGDGRVRLTFSELTDRAARVAAGLVHRGLQPGDRVVLLVRDREAALVPAVAVLWAGGTLVIPPSARGWRIALAAAARARPIAVFADPPTWLLAAALPGLSRAPIRIGVGRRRWPGLVAMGDLSPDGAPGIGGPVPRAARDPALVTWTTGTTGRPRAIVRSHGVLAAQHAAMRRLRGPRPGDVDLAGLPNVALHDLACGVAAVMPPRAEIDLDGALLRATVARAGVTTAAGFPALFERLVDGAAPGALPRLRSIHVGGAPVRPDLLEGLSLVAPNAEIVVVYGATEVEPIAAVEAGELRASAEGRVPGRGLLVGEPFEGIELRLAPLDGAARTPASATSAPSVAREPSVSNRGRILVRGPRVAYDRARSDADGWLETGDVGAIDADGRLWLLGRTANAVPGGLLPAEIEEPVAALDDVVAAAVVTTPGPGGPGAVLAVESSAAPVADATVRARVARLARERGWKLDRIVVVRGLPRDRLSGKIDYRRLRALVR